MIVIIDDGDVDLLGIGSSVASDGTNLNEDGFIAFGEVVVDQVNVEEALRLPVRIVRFQLRAYRFRVALPMVSRVMVVLSAAGELSVA